VCQQDASEAFTFITGALELPLLTLKMDIYHTGREDKEDDHKFVNERLLEVAVPEQEGDKDVTLEDCLETYFNNRIEVKRYLERQNTLSSIRHTEHGSEKNQSIHIETLELSGTDSPMCSTPTALTLDQFLGGVVAQTAFLLNATPCVEGLLRKKGSTKRNC
jgi:hypothetical protein